MQARIRVGTVPLTSPLEAVVRMSHAAGVVGALVAIMGFGSQGVFVKGETIRKHDCDPLLVAMLFSSVIGWIGAIGCLIFLFAEAIAAGGGAAGWSKAAGDFQPSLVRAACAAACYGPANILFLWAARRIGVGVATGVVAASSSLTAMLTAHFVHQVPVSGKSIGALLLVFLCAFGQAATKHPMLQDDADDDGDAAVAIAYARATPSPRLLF